MNLHLFSLLKKKELQVFFVLVLSILEMLAFFLLDVSGVEVCQCMLSEMQGKKDDLT